MRIDRVLINPQQAHAAITDAYQTLKPLLLAGHEFALSVKPKTRSTAQNSLMFSCLTDISNQVDWRGQKLDPESWKDMATAALKRQRVVPGIDGGFVVLGTRTSKMTVGEMSELIEFLMAFGDERGVRWSRTSLGRDVPDEAVCE